VHRGGDGYRGTISTCAVLHARQVVIATGPFQTPAVPASAAGLDPVVMQLPRRPVPKLSSRSVPARPVLVVGDGNSGRQIAAELAGTRGADLATSGMTAVMSAASAGA
jgi:putative flavoprotein involved in K+ transport